LWDVEIDFRTEVLQLKELLYDDRIPGIFPVNQSLDKLLKSEPALSFISIIKE
jgi:hypothetical protein